MNLINPSPDPMIYLEEKGGMIRNYSVSLILDTSYSCFNPLSTPFSLQTLRLMLSTLTSIDLPSFDFVLSRQKEPEILCSNLSSVRAINPKSTLWESLLSILDHPCSKSDLASAIETVFDLKRMRSSEYTSYLFILTDGLYQENEYKRYEELADKALSFMLVKTSSTFSTSSCTRLSVSLLELAATKTFIIKRGIPIKKNSIIKKPIVSEFLRDFFKPIFPPLKS